MVQVNLLLVHQQHIITVMELFSKYECNNNDIFCLPIMKTFKTPRTIDCHNTCYVSFWDEEDPLFTPAISHSVFVNKIQRLGRKLLSSEQVPRALRTRSKKTDKCFVDSLVAECTGTCHSGQ